MGITKEADESSQRLPAVVEKLAEWEEQRGLRASQRTAVYVSTPITTGLTYLSWFQRTGHRLQKGTQEYSAALRADVILPNTQRASRFIELLRWNHVGLIIDPTSFDVPGWDQTTYHEFWTKVIERHARRVIFLDGWEFSRGCTLEFEMAQRLGLDCVDEKLISLDLDRGIKQIEEAIKECRKVGINTTNLDSVFQRLRPLFPIRNLVGMRELYKDQILDHLAYTANVAQFVSFAPGSLLTQRYCRIRNFEPNHSFTSAQEALRALIERSPEGTVNIRSFDPVRPEGNPLVKRLRSLDHIQAKLRELGEAGLYTIVNETIDESDGGVSGVCYRGVIEFAPDANPRCVDDEDIETAAFPFELGMALLKTVYGLEPDLRGREGARVEFSIHPQARGWMPGNTVIWQSEQRPARELKQCVHWPNRFSRFLGDKAFGLAVAAAAGLPVPRTTVFGRRFFPFVFGLSTGAKDIWTRPCPEVKTPGFYPSVRGWRDPHAVLERWQDVLLETPKTLMSRVDDSSAASLISVLIQQEVFPEYSGKLKTYNDSVQISGVKGEGGAFMLGEAASEPIPTNVCNAVFTTHRLAQESFGQVEMEWVFDGVIAWIVQLGLGHRRERIMPSDDAIEWVRFQFSKGSLEDFRQKVMALRGTGKGIIVIGNVSPLSHVGEIAEQHNVPVHFSHS